MVYISSPTVATANRAAVMQAQSDLARSQTELSSGTLADAGLTLGGRSSRLVSLASAQDSLQAMTDTNALAATRLTATATALTTLTTTATSVLSALTKAASGTGTMSLGETAKSSLAAMTAILNTSVSGQYVFAGIDTDRAPLSTYAQSPPSAAKTAVDAAFSATFGSAPTAAIDGDAMRDFLDNGFAALFSSSSYQATWSSASSQTLTSRISPGETATTSVSANEAPFRRLSQAYAMISEFGTGTLSAGATAAVMASASKLVTEAIAGLTGLGANVGITQTQVSDATDRMAAQTTLLSSQASDLDAVDPYGLTTRITSLQTQIQASYEITSKLQQLSLVNYL